MNKPDTSLTKICSHCGQRKPLSAFLQLASSSHGYGNICSACRKAAFENPPAEQEESTRSTTGAKIDAKLKVKDTADKREAFKETEEEYFEERDKKEQIKIERTEKILHVADDKKKHRSFLENRTVPDSNKKNAPGTAVFGGEAHKAAAGKVDLQFTRVAGQLKTSQSSIYHSFKTWLGNPHAKPSEKPSVVSAAEKAVQQKTGSKTAPAPEATPDEITEFTHTHSGPKSRG